MNNARLAINEFTTAQLSFAEDVNLYARSGITTVGVMRSKIEAYGVKRGAQLLHTLGMHASSLCIAGFFVEPDREKRLKQIDDALRAIDIAAQIGAETLVLVAGPAGVIPSEPGQAYLCEGIANLLPAAQAAHIRLSLEPLHPMYASEASMLCTLGDALAVAMSFPKEDVGIIIDTYHLWWHIHFLADIQKAASRIFGVHLSDWRQPTRSFTDRELPGQGIIQWAEVIDAIEKTGYRGVYELEIISEEWWSYTPEKLLAACLASYNDYIVPYLYKSKGEDSPR